MTTFLDQLLTKTSMFRACALMGSLPVFLDHTAPICSFLDIPLLTPDPQVKLTYEPLYPGLKCQVKKWDVRYLIENFSTVFYPFRPEPSFSQSIEHYQKNEPNNPVWKKKMRFIYHLHGCSDKGYHSNWIAPKSHFLDVDHILLYGKRMEDLFKDKKVLSRLKSYSLIGNYRKTYFSKHKDFFEKQAYRHVFSHFKKEQPTILYAPTWKDPENSCSLFEAYQYVLDQLPSHYNLILKLHPYLSLKTQDYDPAPLYRKLHPYAQKPNVEIVPALPLVYPLLEKVCAYIGDFSSIGYDALSFNIPLFFINSTQRAPNDKGAFLHRCGKVFHHHQLKDLFKEIDKSIKQKIDPYLKIKKMTYDYAYGEELSYEETQKKLQELIL